MRIGFTCSTFDLLHAGHVMMLREAKEQCDYLVCGLQVDPTLDRPNKNRPVQTIVERHAQLAAVRYVDEIIPYVTEADLEDILSMYPIDVRILGEEYRDTMFTGRVICEERGIEIYFNKREHRFSTTNLRRAVELSAKDDIAKLRKFYDAVAELTLNHDVLKQSAVVYPSKLGPLLEEIDPKWYMRTGNGNE